MPQALVGYDKDIDDFAAQCRSLCMQLLRLFALGLKVCSIAKVSVGADADPAERSILWKAAQAGFRNGTMSREDPQAVSYVSCVYFMTNFPSIRQLIASSTRS